MGTHKDGLQEENAKVLDIKELVGNGNKVTFDSYRQGHFYYNVPRLAVDEDDVFLDVYQFTVPIEDIGTATLLAEDKAITFMRWIRKAINEGTLIKLI